MKLLCSVFEMPKAKESKSGGSLQSNETLSCNCPDSGERHIGCSTQVCLLHSFLIAMVCFFFFSSVKYLKETSTKVWEMNRER